MLASWPSDLQVVFGSSLADVDGFEGRSGRCKWFKSSWAEHRESSFHLRHFPFKT